MTVLLGDARVRIRPDMGTLDKEVKRGVGGALKGAAVYAAGAVAASGLISGFKDAITAASDLNETQNKANVIFGKSAGSIAKWAKTASTSFGLSEEAALASAASLGDMFLQLGFNEKAAVKTSKATVQFAADLGSFNNLETEDVLQRISAAYRGEYDSLQALIPNINAARVEQVAMNMSGKESVKQLTAEDKALAVNAILKKDGARAAGDFAKTADGLANSTKSTKAQFADFTAELGKQFLPIAARVMNYMRTDGIPTLKRLWASFKKDILPALISVGGAVVKVGKWFANDLMPFIRELGERVAPLFTDALKDLKFAFSDTGDGGNSFMTVLKGVWTVVKVVITVVVSLIGHLVKGLGQALKLVRILLDNVVIPGLKTLTRVFLDVVGVIINGAATMFGWVPGVGPKLKEAAEKFNKFKENVNRSLDGVKANKNVSLTVKVNGQNVGIRYQGDKVVFSSNGRSTTAMKTGGVLPGYSPGRDNMRFMSENGDELNLSGGEGIMRPEGVRVLGAEFLERVNSAARQGGEGGVRRTLGFAGGGIFTNARQAGLAVKQSIPPAYNKFVAAVTTIYKRNASRIGTLADPLGGLISAGAAGGRGVQRWAPVVLQALRMLGLPEAYLGITLRRMNQESGGNPRAINLWDSNAKAGIPSMGLMQTILPTFNSYAGPFRSRGPYDPLANIYASMRYALDRYGSLPRAYNRRGGYKNGTLNALPGWSWVGENGPELMRMKGGEQVKSAPNSRAASSIIDVRVFIGDKELTDLVDVRINQHDNSTATELRYGRRV